MIHIKKEGEYRTVCQSRFNTNNHTHSVNVQWIDEKRFLEIFKEQPNFCCKKCLATLRLSDEA